jgi:hypothetical protein
MPVLNTWQFILLLTLTGFFFGLWLAKAGDRQR